MRRASPWNLAVWVMLLALPLGALASGCAGAPRPEPPPPSPRAPGCEAELRALERLLSERQADLEAAQDDARRRELLTGILDEAVVDALVTCLAKP